MTDNVNEFTPIEKKQQAELEAENKRLKTQIENVEQNAERFREALDKIFTTAGVDWWDGEPPAQEVTTKLQKLHEEIERLKADYKQVSEWHMEDHAKVDELLAEAAIAAHDALKGGEK
jgi:uncharacterized coiled-coil DUF342 family protein